MEVTIEDIAKEIEPDAWARHDATLAKADGSRPMANDDIWAIESSIKAAERVGKMLENRGVKNEK